MRIGAVRFAKTGCIIASVLLMVLGLVMIICPDLSVSLIGVVAGVMLIIMGLLKLTGYFSRDLYRLAFQYDLAFGLLMVVLGALLLLQPGTAMHLLCLIVGICITGDGLLKVQTALDSRRFGLERWWLILALGVLAALIGIVAIFRPVEGAQLMMLLLGIALLSEGALNLCVTLCAVKIVRNARPDVIEVEVDDRF